jgi:hypothetical protein
MISFKLAFDEDVTKLHYKGKLFAAVERATCFSRVWHGSDRNESFNWRSSQCRITSNPKHDCCGAWMPQSGQDLIVAKRLRQVLEAATMLESPNR